MIPNMSAESASLPSHQHATSLAIQAALRLPAPNLRNTRHAMVSILTCSGSSQTKLFKFRRATKTCSGNELSMHSIASSKAGARTRSALFGFARGTRERTSQTWTFLMSPGHHTWQRGRTFIIYPVGLGVLPKQLRKYKARSATKESYRSDSCSILTATTMRHNVREPLQFQYACASENDTSNIAHTPVARRITKKAASR